MKMKGSDERLPFSAQAAQYVRYRPSYPVGLYEFIFRHLDRKRIAWDCGTGSGQVANWLATRFETVHATDISREQLQHATRRANIRYMQAPAENSGLPSDVYDLITVAQAIHWFDFGEFYKEVQRVGRKDGLLAVFGYGKVQINQVVDPIIHRLYRDAFRNHYHRQRSYVESQYQTLPFPFEEIPAPSFQTTKTWTFQDLAGYFNTWSAIQKIKKERIANPAIKTIQALSRHLPEEEPFRVSFPIFLRLGRIRKD